MHYITCNNINNWLNIKKNRGHFPHFILKFNNNLDTCSSVWNNQSAEYHHCHHSFAPGVTPTWQIDRTTFQPNIPTWFFNFASGLLRGHINRSLNKLSPQKNRSRHQRFSLIGKSLVTKLPISLWVDQASQLIKCLLKCERLRKCF